MLNLSSIIVGTKQPQAMKEFYEKVIGKPADMADNEGSFLAWKVGNGYFSVLEHSQMEGSTKEPGRVMFNFETADVRTEFERIRSLGGMVIMEPYQMGDAWIATLADPDGNYFQLVSPFPTE